MKYLVYSAKNIKNGMVYVGRTKRSLSQRKAEHLTTANSNRCKNNFHRAIMETGQEFFEWSILESNIDDQDFANSREVFFCDLLNSRWPNGYNTMKPGGFNPEATERTRSLISQNSTGRKLSDEAKDKIRIKNVSNPNTPIGKPMTEESRSRLLASHIGKPISESAKEKIRMAMIDREFTDEHRKNLSEAGRRRVTTDALREALREGQRRRWARSRGEIE